MTLNTDRGDGAWRKAAAAVARPSGWRRYAIALALGAAAALALPPLHAVPVLAVAFTGLVWQLDGVRTRRAAFALGWWFGFGHFVAGIYWIAFALLTDAAKFGWMIPFAVGGSSAYLALYPGVAVLVTQVVCRRGPGRVLVLAAAWTAGEWARGVVLTGFPWNPMGNVWTEWVPMIQLAAVTGVFGVSLVTVAAAAAPAALADRGRRRWVPMAVAAVALLASWAGGSVRLAAARTDVVPGVMLRLVQPNIAQTHKWRADLRQAQFAKLLKMSAPQAGTAPRLVIWSETAVPFFVAREPSVRRLMAELVPPDGYLITGAPRTTATRERPFRIWNSLHALDASGRVVASYDKFQLVPFGEYVPLRSILSFAKLTVGDTDFSAGPGPQTVSLPGLPPFSPRICYEAIFPGRVVDPDRRPAWLLNVTNDAWFGISSGPYQHFASARMRAVEEGLPLVRVANTGISAIVDSYGRVTRRLDLGLQGVIDGPLPIALAEATWFARWRQIPAALSILGVLFVGLALGRRRADFTA